MHKITTLICLLLFSTVPLIGQDVMVVRSQKGESRVMRVSDLLAIEFTDHKQQNDLFVGTEINPLASAYLGTVVYSDDDYRKSEIGRFLPPEGTRGDHPLPIRLHAPKEAATADRVRVFSAEGGFELPQLAKVERGEAVVHHLLPNRTYRVLWLAENSFAPLAESSIFATGELRMIGLKRVLNVRDFGGWPAMEGRRVRHGWLYRGAQLHNPADGNIATEADVTELRRLGIRAELDLRGNQESGKITASPLGNDIRYNRIAGGGIYPYAEMITRFPEDIKEVFREVLDNLRQGRPTYIHCAQGADRTGTIAFLLNGILGVSESDLAKDFELTSLSPVGIRSRVFYPEQKEINYAALVRALDKYNGQTLLERLENYFLSVGITRAEIEEYRLFMLY